MYYCLYCTTWAGSGIVENAKRHMKSKHPHIRLPDKETDNLTIRTNQQIETFLLKAKNEASIYHTQHLTRQIVLEALVQLIISGVTDITGVSVLDWWLQEGQRKRYPRLSRLARDIFSIPPMSDEPERVFSSTRRVIRWDRASLGDSSVENIACMKHWIQNGLCESYIPLDIDLGVEDDVEESLEKEEEVLVSDELD